MKKDNIYNLGANLISFAVTFLISFLITPIIISKIGKEVYGFYGLSNSFTTYVTIITVAINSLAGRFVTISLHQGKEKDANQYFSSVIIVNLFVAVVALVPAVMLILFLEHVLNLPTGHLLDIKLTFACNFAAFFLNLIFSIFSVATFATNKIYLASIRQIEASLLKIGVIFLLFACFNPMITFVAFATFVSAVFVVWTNLRYTKKLLPNMKFSFKHFSFEKVKELFFSGMWNSIVALSNMLLEGLDLLISNLFLGPVVMGTISIVKTIPNTVQSLLSSMLGVFLPPLTINYAKGHRDEMIRHINSSAKIMSIIFALPIAFIIVFGKEFYSIWLPKEDSFHLWALSSLSILNMSISCTVSLYYNLFSVTNRLKMPAIATLATGIISTATVLLLLRFTDLGVYAVVGVSVILGIIRNLFFNLPYAAKCIDINPMKFYGYTFRGIILDIIAIGIAFIVKINFEINDWVTLIVPVLIFCVLAFVANGLACYSVREIKSAISDFLKRRAKKND